uniref:Uncharacterized protein n=1 Tax=viral metagenome TaxID=1070528 RepID=A0A6C0BC33_9ZZZZ
MDRIVIEDSLNISDLVFEDLIREVKNGNFFFLLKTFNDDVVVSCKNENNEVTSICIKNIVDKSDDEISLIRFKYSNNLKDGKLLIDGKSEKEFSVDGDEDFFLVNYEDFLLEISKEKLIFIMNYNTKVYPKCVFTLIEKYFKKIFENLRIGLLKKF